MRRRFSRSPRSPVTKFAIAPSARPQPAPPPAIQRVSLDPATGVLTIAGTGVLTIAGTGVLTIAGTGLGGDLRAPWRASP